MISKVNDNLVLYDEHTFGAAESIWDNTCWNSQIQFQSKGAFAWTAQRDARLLMETAGGYLQALVAKSEVPTITLFNPLAWNRDSYAQVYIDEVVVPRGHDFKIVDEPQTALNAPAQSDVAVMENAFYKVCIDKEKGCIASIFDKVNGKELVDPGSEWGFGTMIYETLQDRWQLVRTDSQGLERFGLTDIRYDDVRYGPLYRIFTVHGKMRGLDDRGAWIEFRLYENSPRIELLYALRRLPETDPSSIYVALPFAGGSDCLSFDVQGGIVHPGVNQLEGSSSEWNTLQNFAKVDNGGSQTIFTSEQMPIVMFGKLLDGPFQYIKTYEHPYIYSWVMNNYWTTNFMASQGGEICFTYDITTMKGNSDADALRYAVGMRTPVYARVMPAGRTGEAGKAGGRQDRLPSSRSLLHCDNGNLVILNAAPSTYDNGIVLQVREMSGTEQVLELLNEKDHNVKFTVVNAIEEPLCRKTGRYAVPANGDIFVKITPCSK